jgi:hypothetical protein
MTLEDFCHWFMNQPIREWVPGDVFNFGSFKSCIVHRDPPFQVEFVIVRSGPGPKPHRHPNVDSIEIGLAGGTVGFIVNDIVHYMRPWETISVRATDWHGVVELPNGAAFYSVQQWLDGVEPSSVGLNWEGSLGSFPDPRTHSRMMHSMNGKWISL